MSIKIRHNKIKNTGILFELLVRQITSDIIMNNKKKSIAKNLLEKYFSSKSDLGKEYILYRSLLNQKFDNKDKANDFINEVIDAHKKLDYGQIKKSKYNLVKEIKQNYEEDDFFKPRLKDYKLMASIYKIFKSKSLNESINPSDVVESRYTILEHILDNSPKKENEENDVIETYKSQSKSMKILIYKMMLKNFNSKYDELLPEQKDLIREYINNISSVNSLKEYVQKELTNVISEINTHLPDISDKVTEIKLKEVLNQLKLMEDIELYNDNHITAILNIYELINELKKIK